MTSCALLCAVSLLLRLADADCRAQLLEASPSSAGTEGWVDADTADEACTKLLPSFAAPYQLVCSDEFNTPDRDFKAAAQDPKWTALNYYYAATGGERHLALLSSWKRAAADALTHSDGHTAIRPAATMLSNLTRLLPANLSR